jgi:hypothetical protein
MQTPEEVGERRLQGQDQAPLHADLVDPAQSLDAQGQAVFALPDPALVLPAGMDDVEEAAEDLEGVGGSREPVEGGQSLTGIGAREVHVVTEGRVE